MGASAEEPAIDIRLGFSRNPLRWVLTLARMLAFLFVFVLIAMSFRDNPCVGVLPFGVVLVFFVQFLISVFSIDRSMYRFFDDRLEVDQHVFGKGRLRRQTHAYADIGHLELSSMKLIKIALKPHLDEFYVAEIPVNQLTSEDVFDEIVTHVQRVAPDHLLSIYEDGYVRFTRECTLEELFPNDVDLVDDVRVRGTVVSVGEREYRFERSMVFTPDGEQLFRAGRSHVQIPTGMVIGTATAPAYREIVLELFNDDVFHIKGAGFEIRWNDEPVGRITQPGDDYGLELSRPLPAVIAMILLAVFIANRKVLRV